MPLGLAASRVMLMDGDVPAANMILVVDDDPSMLRSVENLLNAHGFEVQVFSSAEDFQARADMSDAACLILDIHLPGMSGFELHEQLSRSGHSVPAIFIRPAIREVGLFVGWMPNTSKKVAYQ
jgi:FixJ family two-component response regulator